METNYILERELYLFGPVNSKTVYEVITRLNSINRYDQEMLAAGPKNYKPQPIALYINSGGGSYYDGIALYSAIKNSPTPVITIGMGMVGSAALLIFLGGQYRVAYSHTTFLYHSAKYGIIGATPHEVDMFNQHYKEINRKMTEITKKETNITEDIIERVYREDFQFYMDPTEAYKLGICHSVYDLEMIEEEKNRKNKEKNDIVEAIKAMAEEIKKEEENAKEPKEEDKEKCEEKQEEPKEDVKEIKEESAKEEEKPKKECDCAFCRRLKEESKK